MKRFLAVAAFSMALASGVRVASAADPIDSGYDWTGPYVGFQAGYGWGDTQPTFDDGVTSENGDVDYEGFVGGIEGGYNWQSGNLVLGLEADGSISDVEGSFLDLAATSRPCIIAGLGCSADVDWFATGRLRLGLAMERVLPFVTGGIAVGGVKGTYDSGVGLACICDTDDVTVGWTVGGGLEWAVNDSWSVKAEYLYVDLGKPSVSGDNTLFTPGVGTDNYDFSIARMGVNFHF
jgi:outer membrane immunogenic protein